MQATQREVPAKEIEVAGKVSSVRPGGLAKLLFGKGEDISEADCTDKKADVPMVEDDEIAEESGARTDFNASSTVRPDDIVFDLADDEKKLLDDSNDD